MKLTKKQVLENLDEVKNYINEIEDEKIKQKEEKKFQIKNRFTGEVIYSSSKTTYKEVLEEAANNEADLPEANLFGADLSGANLYGADLSGANLYGANLSKANLFGADLSGANLSGANLSGANLSGANLSGANLSEADLFGADLSEADLSGANLSKVEMQNVKFYGKGGNTKIKKTQLNDFLKAIGVIMED